MPTGSLTPFPDDEPLVRRRTVIATVGVSLLLGCEQKPPVVVTPQRPPGEGLSAVPPQAPQPPPQAPQPPPQFSPIDVAPQPGPRPCWRPPQNPQDSLAPQPQMMPCIEAPQPVPVDRKAPQPQPRH